MTRGAADADDRPAWTAESPTVYALVNCCACPGLSVTEAGLIAAETAAAATVTVAIALLLESAGHRGGEAKAAAE